MDYKAKLDRIFSEYIRRRDSRNGYGKCISCGKIVHWKDADAGHFVNRKHMSLRYDEKNVNLQCRACNRFDEGNMLGYSVGIVKKYGSDVLDYLAAKKRNSCKISPVTYVEMIKHYQDKINASKKD